MAEHYQVKFWVTVKLDEITKTFGTEAEAEAAIEDAFTNGIEDELENVIHRYPARQIIKAQLREIGG